MRTRLKRELHDLLLKDGISLETHLFNDFVFQMAGIKIDENESGIGFDLTTSSWDKDESLKFSLPKIKLPQILQLMTFLNINSNEYAANSPVLVDEKHVFDKLLPDFKDFYETTKITKPEVIAKYVVQSKPILESSAVNTITSYCRKALKLLINNDAEHENTFNGELVNNLLLLENTVNALREWPVLYKSVIASANTINNMLNLPEVSQNKDLAKNLQMIGEGIELFKRFNRNKSVLSNIYFNKEMEAFLNQDQLKLSASQCEVVENTLLKLANVSLGVKGKSRMHIGHDASRMVLELDDINQQNTQKLIQYLQALGDETVIEGSGYTRRGGPIPESQGLKMMSMDLPFPRPREESYVESHSVEMDGKFLFETLLPKLKTEIAALSSSDPATLKRYQEESRPYFDKKAAEEAKSKNKYVLFQPLSVNNLQGEAVVKNVNYNRKGM